MLPLGHRAGVPPRAAAVDTAAFLGGPMAQQVREPSAILLPPHRRSEALPRAYARTASTYAEYVRRNVRAGLQRLVRREHVAKHKGRLIISGAFAVPEDAAEDRAISALCPLNALVDQDLVQQPRFAQVHHLRAVCTTCALCAPPPVVVLGCVSE